MFVGNAEETIVCGLCGYEGHFDTPLQGMSRRDALCPACGAGCSVADLAGVIARELCGAEAPPLARCLKERGEVFATVRLLALDPPPALDALFAPLPGYQRVSCLTDLVPGRISPEGVLCQDAGCLTFPDGSFDLVVSHDFFEHVADPWLAFAEAGRVLRAGGRHIFTVPLHEQTATRARACHDESGLLRRQLPEVFRGGGPGGSGLFVYTDFGGDLPAELSRRGLPTQCGGQRRFSASGSAWTLDTDDGYRRYLFMRSRGALSRFFHYHSHILVTRQPREALPGSRCRVRFTPVTSVFQALTAADLAEVLSPAPTIFRVRGECVRLSGRRTRLADITLEAPEGGRVIVFMAEVVWGPLPTFIFPDVFASEASGLAVLAEALLPVLAPVLGAENPLERFVVDGRGQPWTGSPGAVGAEARDTGAAESGIEAAGDDGSGAREPGAASCHACIAQARRKALLREQAPGAGRVLDLVCGGEAGQGQRVFCPGAEPALAAGGPYDALLCSFSGGGFPAALACVDFVRASLMDTGTALLFLPNPEHMPDLADGAGYFSLSQAEALLGTLFAEVEWLWQDGPHEDLARHHAVRPGRNPEAPLWIARCRGPREEEAVLPKVSIIMPLFNGWELTRKAVASVLAQTPDDPAWELILVDNGSTDATGEGCAALRAGFPGKVLAHRNPVNLGFAKASNQGALLARGEVLVFLNNDTEVRGGWLVPLLHELEHHPETGIAGGKLLYPDGRIQHAGVAVGRDLIPFHVHRGLAADHPLVEERRVYSMVTAACAAVRRNEFMRLGLFDEAFVNGHEDIDLCLRYREQGLAAVYRPDCVVTHHESVSAGRMDARPKNLARTRNKWRHLLVQDDFRYKTREDARQRPERPLRFALKMGAPTRAEMPGWGDTYFAECLAASLEKAGHACEIHCLSEWGREDRDIDVVIHIKGLSEYYPKPWNINIMWMLNHPELHTREELSRYDAVAAASAAHAERLQGMVDIPVLFLPQATDPGHFSPTPAEGKRYDLVFVGNNIGVGRLEMRKIVRDALPTPYSLAVWGKGWNGLLPEGVWQGEHLPWEDLPRVYRQSRIVLNDHQPEMAANGFVNNRTFDALACGSLVVSDAVQGMRDLIPVPEYTTPGELRALLDGYLANPEKARADAERLCRAARQEFTFDKRAASLLDIAAGLAARADVGGRIRAARARVNDTDYRRRGPLVSVLMSTHNRRVFLPAAIESIRAQNYSDWELCLVCDGGPPVDDIAAAFADPRIRVLTLPERRGKGHAVNQAFAMCRGEYVAYLDDDDIWYPDHLERLMLAVRELPGIRMAYSDAALVTLDMAAPPHKREIGRTLRYNYQVTLNPMLEHNFINGISVLHHRDLFTLAGGLDPRLKALIDFDMWRRLMVHTYAYHVSRVTADHYLRKNGGSAGEQVTGLAERDPVAYSVQRMRVICKKLPFPEGSPLHGVWEKARKRARFEYLTTKCDMLYKAGEKKRADLFLRLAESLQVPSLTGLRHLAYCHVARKNHARALETFKGYLGTDGVALGDYLYAVLAALEVGAPQDALLLLQMADKKHQPHAPKNAEQIREYREKGLALLAKQEKTRGTGA